MDKAHIATRIVIAILALAALVAGLAFTAPARAQNYSQPGNQNAAQASFSAVTSEVIFSQTTSDCYSTAYHAASDCDRLASQAIAQHDGPAKANCYSTAYHAASDCDRLASQAIVQFVGPTTTNCFSAAYHAASDCDRLVFEISTALAYK